MNTSQTKSPVPALNEHEQNIFDALLHPMFMTLMLGLIVFGGGAIMTLSALKGAIPGTLASITLGWAGVWLGSVLGFSALMGMIFLKPLALKFIAISRTKNVTAQ